mmetsp:Transcript_4852/g.427  ORF Transcript_4852/g.427 Transcript_4852/m.427 type:complete len:96 (-) Transcript_4852:110-397(-)
MYIHLNINLKMGDLIGDIIIVLIGKKRNCKKNMGMKKLELEIKNKFMIIMKFINRKKKMNFMKKMLINVKLKEYYNGHMNIELIYKIIGMGEEKT